MMKYFFNFILYKVFPGRQRGGLREAQPYDAGFLLSVPEKTGIAFLPPETGIGMAGINGKEFHFFMKKRSIWLFISPISGILFNPCDESIIIEAATAG